MYCVKCGTKLEQGKCQSCGSYNDLFEYSKPKNEKMTNKIKLLAVASIAVIIAAVVFFTMYLIKDTKYKQALNDYDIGNFTIAAEKFEELKGFKDSKQFLSDCNEVLAYNHAVNLFENLDYENAIVIFEELGRYEDSREYRKLCRFNLDYKEARIYMEIDEFLKALRIFEDMPEFKDCAELLVVCECRLKLEKTDREIESGNPSAAFEILDELENTINNIHFNYDEMVTMQEVKYYQGICFYEQELYYSAYRAFKDAGQFKDAPQQAKECIQPSVTKEIYSNPNYPMRNVRMRYRVIKDSYLEESVCIKIFDKNANLVSVSFIAYGDELTISLPSGKYYYEACYGEYWFGEKEYFGYIEFFSYDGLFNLQSGKIYYLDF